MSIKVTDSLGGKYVGAGSVEEAKALIDTQKLHGAIISDDNGPIMSYPGKLETKEPIDLGVAREIGIYKKTPGEDEGEITL